MPYHGRASWVRDPTHFTRIACKSYTSGAHPANLINEFAKAFSLNSRCPRWPEGIERADDNSW